MHPDSRPCVGIGVIVGVEVLVGVGVGVFEGSGEDVVVGVMVFVGVGDVFEEISPGSCSISVLIAEAVSLNDM